jgi:hypothetical protein
VDGSPIAGAVALAHKEPSLSTIAVLVVAATTSASSLATSPRPGAVAVDSSPIAAAAALATSSARKGSGGDLDAGARALDRLAGHQERRLGGGAGVILVAGPEWIEESSR